MAYFCRQCSINIFGKDYGDLKGITSEESWAAHRAAYALCENCGYVKEFVERVGSLIQDKRVMKDF